MKTETKEAFDIMPPKPPELDLSDRCDVCHAEALVRIVMPSGKDLIMCNHHTNRNELALTALGCIFYRKNTDFLLVNRLKGSDK